MKPQSSETTTALRGAYSLTTPPHGGRGLATRSNTAVAAWLAERTPRQVEDALALRLRPLGVSLRWAADYHETLGGFRSGVSVICEDGADMGAARDAIEASLTPAPQEVLMAWLAELSVRVMRREHDDFSDGLTVEVYSRELMRYPADAAKRAIFNKWAYWPALDSELLPVAEFMTRGRRMALERLGRAPEPAELPAPRVDAARARAIIAEVAEKRRIAE